jgi:hypothetical protein
MIPQDVTLIPRDVIRPGFSSFLYVMPDRPTDLGPLERSRIESRRASSIDVQVMGLVCAGISIP